MSNGSNYFNALMRSAGMAPNGGAPAQIEPMAATGAGEVFDPFEAAEAIEAIDAVAPAERGDAPAPVAPIDPPTRPQAMPAASTPVRAHESLPTALTRDAHPAVQAALRWVTAAAAPVPEPASPAIAEAVADRPSPDPKPVAALVQPHPSPPAMARVEHIRTPLSGPDAPIAAAGPEPRLESQAAAAPQALAPRNPRAEDLPVTASPARRRQAEPAERATSGSGRTEVHIGTLHVTLDAAATARFATRSIAPPAPQAARNNPASNAQPSSARQATGSSLSRSRLPRW